MKKIVALLTLLTLIVPNNITLADDVSPDGPTVTASDMVVYTNNPDPQAVSYDASASDPTGLEVSSFECDPASGSLFPVDFNTVTCTAINSVGSTTVRTFSIELILDTTPPEITPPATQTFSTTTFPALPTLTYATATDDSGLNPEISHEPTSFSAGTTTVTWTATDQAGNSAAATSEVVIIDESEPADAGFEIEGIVSLPNGCQVTDTLGTVHYFPTATTTEYLAICALTQAVEDGIIDDFTAQEFSGFGLFIDTINGVSEDGMFWALYINGESAEVGVTQLALVTEDEIQLVLTTFEGEAQPYSLTLTIGELVDTYNNIILPNACSVTDTGDVVHEYSEQYLAICAVVEALKEGYIASFDAVHFDGFGLFIDNFNDIEKLESTYWQFFVDETSSDSGVTSTELAIGSEISFLLSDFDNNAVEPEQLVALRVIGLVDITEDAPEEETPSGGGGGGGGISHLTFDVPAALAYLTSKQNDDGSFSSSLLTDWVALAFAAQNPGEAKIKLTAHLTSSNPSLSGVLDYIRHAMALMSLGINPYSGTSIDYIAPIVASYDGTQIGDTSLTNDDIFALFPLSHAGYSASELMIQNIVSFIVSRQSADGSWVGGADMTAAAVQALTPYSALPGVSAALAKATTYLHAQQQSNGGFGNSFATSWSMQAIAALGQNETSWAPGGFYPRDYLASLQQSDGGVEPASTNQDTRVWATAYAIPGALGKTWHSLLVDFSKPSTAVTGGGSTVATSTATSTPTTTAANSDQVATSTPPTGEVLGEIISAIADETPQEAFEARIAQVSPDESKAPTAPEEATTTEQALEQIAAAALVDGTNWTLVVLAFLALLLFGIVGYVAFVRKYWN
jgi:hypothetical protein